MSLDLTLRNALSGIQSSQAALQTISNNIANANTDGYSRKIADPSSRVVDGRGFGVEIGEIRRSVDEGILALLRKETAVSEKLKQKENFMSQINKFFGRPEDNSSITHMISELGSQFDALAVSPESEAAQFMAVAAAEDVLREIKQMSDEVQRLRNEANTVLNATITEFNKHVEAVASINGQIINFTNSNLNATELQDQRDISLTKLSEFINLQYFEAGDGSLNVFAGTGQTIVNGGSSQTLNFQSPSLIDARSEYTPPSAPSYIGPGNAGHPVGGIPGIFVGEVLASNDLTNRISAGKMRGLIEVRDFELPTLQAELDELAEKLKNEINAVHNNGTGGPAPFAFIGDRYVSTDMKLEGSGHVRIGVLDDFGNLQEDKIFDLSAPEGFSSYESSVFTSATADVITTGGTLTFTDDAASFSTTVNYNASATLTSIAAAINANGTLSGQGITASVITDATTDGVTNLSRLKITDAGGQTFNISEAASGTLISDISPRLRTVGDLVTGLSTMTNLTASVTSSGRLQLSTNDNKRLAINELTSSISAAGDLDRGFSDFFGLNRLIDSTENFSIYRSDIFSSQSSDIITTAGTLQFTGNDGSAWNTTVAYSATDTLTSLVAKINADTTLQAENISARVVVDGATQDKFRVEITDATSDEFTVVETSGGSFLTEGNLRTDTRGLSNRMKIRNDIKENNSFLSRGTLQSNTFQSRALNSKTADFASTTPAVSAGALTIIIDGTTSVTKAYATTNSLEDLVSSINADTTLIGANISAEAVVDGSSFSLKIRDNNGDDLMVRDTGGLNVDVSQGASLGDNAGATAMAEVFAKAITFSTIPAKGTTGGLPTSKSTLTDYSAKILSTSSAQAFGFERELNFQENLREELSSKNSSISGVNMDEELASLIIFEQAFMAAARVMTVTSEMFEDLANML